MGALPGGRHDPRLSVKGTAEAPDFSAVTDPAAHPRVGSDGDLTGDGLPDLWSADATGKVTVSPGTGTPTPHPTVTGFGPAVRPTGRPRGRPICS
ncbi:hypothetical protein [Streptomyces virginiae]|uniref:hypothetical protein n=1 Tax=Streptomyces virginiae TaxID=1961 RepID=UPI003327B671